MKRPLTETKLGSGIAKPGSRITWLEPATRTTPEHQQFLTSARAQNGLGPFIVKKLRQTLNGQVLICFNNQQNLYAGTPNLGHDVYMI
ncbi:MAG: hypothetical protein AUJ28_03245 [Parcubacteria group bacterium CG1_02_37_51]|uniref:Uncharacterized protein n=1 Tax=Candidatus Komeilibacteria bacterium CG_4_10_14_0_8_um_filter_37_78 TaxID=1974471 RepID=A0A2M7RDI3_9BACT|nr:MAG: hypothetical protein AUJ28_03245 [Parcubacteria group bacterium CG1_02_37_51]PIY94376.1 MAG: hypothetical protein COY67_02645 [Candidatus Komeilibacteria bacterium CG_4_10_14_0_8_um_filter_37_78]